MKLPKIKIKKLSKKAETRILQGACVIMYSLGVGLYGYLNYMEGMEDEWRHIADNADKAENGAIIFHEGDMESEDNMYWVAGKERSKEIWKTLQEMAKKKDEQENG